MAMKMLRVSLGGGDGDDYAAEAEQARANADKRGGLASASPIAVVLDLLGVGRQKAKPPKKSAGEAPSAPVGDSVPSKAESQVSTADRLINSTLLTTGIDPLPMGVSGVPWINPFGHKR
jgi:hypothetical protein